MNKKLLLLLGFLLGWVLIYSYLSPAANWFTDVMLEMKKGTRLTEAVRFFLFEYPKVLMLLALVVFFVGVVRSYLAPEQMRKILEKKSIFTGNVLASALGIITPFCSCSAIPLFLGFVETGIPLGVTFSFLISAPMINEVAIVLLGGLFGWKVVVIYILTGLIIAIVSGWIIGRLKLEHWVQDWVYNTKIGKSDDDNGKMKLSDRIDFGYSSVREIVKKVWIYIGIGIAVGAGVHSYVPENFMVALMGKSVWYSVPLSVLIGIPLYSNAAGIIPIVSVLLEKGAALGTSLAFMMSVIGLSLPEIIILKRVLKLPLILSFVGIVAVGIIIVGYLFNFLF